jgi:hypothetical protein
MIDPEIIDIGSNFKSSTIKLNNDNDDDISMPSFGKKANVNFGSGIELLMNEKRKNDGNGKSGPSSDIDLGDINELENELNDLGSGSKNVKSLNKSNLFNSILGGGGNKRNDDVNIEINSYDSNHTIDELPTINIGKDTAKDTPDKTWDGFQKFNDIPLDTSKKFPAQPAMSKEELLREKFRYLRRLEELESKGAHLSKKYTMDSSLQEMQGEYEMIIAEKEKANSIKFQGKILMAAITGIEFLNNKFDPFDIKIDGWSEQCNENINDYDEIFAELHEKYKSKSKMAPELKLLFQLAGSAVMVHMTNTMFKSAMPGMDDIMRQNPELMQQFTQAAVNSMGQNNPGFSGFMNNFMPGAPPTQGGGFSQPPPPPIATQQSVYRPNQQGPTNRPDISSARGDGINIQETFGKAGGAERSTKRPEMKGPNNDINDIISNMKTKSISIQQPKTNEENTSTISIKDMEELNGKTPKTKRRPKSEKNTISLDI